MKERRLGARPSGAVAGEGEVAARALLPLTAQIPLRDPGDLQKREQSGMTRPAYYIL